MRLTAEKANELICPFLIGDNTFERDTNQHIKNIKCISIKCMAWVKCYPLDKNETQGYCKRIYNEK